MVVIDATFVPDASGKAPDLQERPPTAPLDLPRLVMRRALVVAIGFLLLSLALGLVAARSDTRDEIAGALALATTDQRLRSLPDDDTLAVASMQAIGELRHVQLQVAAADGRVLFRTEPPASGVLLHWLMRIDLRNRPPGAAQTVTWSVPRPGGPAWTATLSASPESELREALTNLLGLAALLAACSLGMLAAMRWNVRRAFRPLQAMLGAIARIERHDLAGVQALPTMPIRELEAVSGALKRLATSLEQAQSARRVLAQQVLTLQEDERQRLARDMHDEFGQRLTALRVDAAWLRKRIGADDAAAPVLDGMGEQLARIQRDVRDLLERLQPLGAAQDGEHETVAHLAQLLDALAASWSRAATGGLAYTARVVLAGRLAATAPADVTLPRHVALALYRISQEALTNAARHGDARDARVELRIDRDAAGELALHWSASDDGRGLAQPEGALQRGNGLAGIKERVFALGGEFEWSATNPPPMRGLLLRVRLTCASSGTPA